MKKNIQRYIWIPIILVVMAAVTAALLLTLPRHQEEPEPEEAVTIELVYAFQNAQWNSCVEEIVRQFDDTHPNIHVTYQLRYEDAVYEDTLNKLAARDELGDIVQLKEPYAYAGAGLIAPLPDELSGLVLRSCVLDGKTYAVAALDATTGVVYNKAIFEENGLSLPETYQEFLSLCAALRARGIDPLCAGGKDLWHMEYWLNHFLRADVLSREPDFLAQCRTGKRDWNNPLVTDMFTHLSQLFQRYVDADWPTVPDAAMAYHIAMGEAAMVYSGPWLMDDITALEPDARLGWFYVPNEDGVTAAGHSVDVFWAVTAGCARDEARYSAAVEFLEFFYSDPVYLQLCEDMAATSVRTADMEDPLKPLERIPEVAGALKDAGLHLSAYVGDENTPIGFEKQLLELIQALCSGGCTVEQAQEQTDQYWKQCAEQEAKYG